MVFPGHIAGGYLATKALLSLTHAPLSPIQTSILYGIGTIAGEGPDIDLIWLFFVGRSSKPNKNVNHRKYITHVPLFWVMICGAITAIGYFTGSTFTKYLGPVILAGVFSHFILDSIEDGIMWLWPLSKKSFCLRKTTPIQIDKRPGSLAYHWEVISKYYIHNITFYAEIAVVLVATYFALFF